MEAVRFFGQFVRAPRTTGAVLPSSSALAGRMLEGLRLSERRVVCEFGPGTGSFTAAILGEVGKETRFFAVEKSAVMAEMLRTRFPEMTVHTESILNIAECCRVEGVDGIDAIICGLPWASFDDEFQKAGLEATWNILRPGGRFVTFAYQFGTFLPAGRRFGKAIRRQFALVEKSPLVWRNFPPALVYRCTK